jgi:hypothetical protein
MMLIPTKYPPQPLPPPLRGEEKPSFTNQSVEERLPEIGKRVIQENELLSAAQAKMEALVGEIPYGKIRLVETPQAGDETAWQGYVTPFVGQNWLQVPWFFVEHYFYRRVLEATGYFEPGIGHGVDPYQHQKRNGLQMAMNSARKVTEEVRERERSGHWQPETFTHLLTMDLWSNQVDLSRWPAALEGHTGSVDLTGNTGNVMVDDSARAMEILQGGGFRQVDLITDNVGFELICDLCLADLLLEVGGIAKIIFHVKAWPVFVSDATLRDALQTIDALYQDSQPQTHSLADRLRSAMEDDALEVRAESFWNSPLALWEMPAEIRRGFSKSRLVIAKGDANYRRILGDRHWDFMRPPQEIAGYFPAPLLAIRSSKSEVEVGLGPEQVEEAEKADPRWMEDGKWGMVQLMKDR